MRILFWASVILNATGLVVATHWAFSKPGYAPIVSASALASSTLSLFYTKPFWISGRRSTVTQISNQVGGDMAGRDIIKKP